MTDIAELTLLRSKVYYTADGVPVGLNDTVFYYFDNEMKQNDLMNWIKHIHGLGPNLMVCYSTQKAARAAKRKSK